MKLVAAVALTLVLCVGCAATPHEEPPPAAPAVSPGISSRAIDHAVEELAKRFRERGLRGWPEHVTLTGMPSRPTVRLSIKSRMTEPLDLQLVADRVTASLTTADVAQVVEWAPPAAEGALDLTGSFSDEVDEFGHVYWITFKLTDPRDGAVLVATRSKSSRITAR
jgi:hypothetical protein